MPLGKLSKRQIQSAYSILNEVQQAVSDSGSESQILDLSNRFYTLIPHDFGMKKPPLLNNLEYIQAKVQMLDNLLDIEVAYSLLRGGNEDGDKDPIDINYEKLRTDIKVRAKECFSHNKVAQGKTQRERYIVYDVAQVNLKYLLKLKFNYKTSLW
ncbi:poly [Limosa lapponica baueri]|uniref:NAD(+) ADP-ribosyltransferase n=1 Tax=Limosa lapponica baueri TaxID=1758121 RepID=A0A2I0U0J1_LIMLA|nr:poly [Limosa lapponica baueri]